MAYCDNEDVTDKTGVAYTDVSQPTRDRVETICIAISSEIDGVLRAAGYTVPVTDVTDVALLKRYATLGSAYEAWHEGFVSDDNPARVDSWQTDYRDFLERIRKGGQTLGGQDLPGELRTWSAVNLRRVDGYSEAAEETDYA